MSELNVRNFSDTEIAELNNYVLTQVPQSVLPRLFILTEEPIKKVRAFIAIYRILQGCKDFVGDKTLGTKLELHIGKAKEPYIKIYELLMDYDDTEMEMKKSNINKKIKLNLLEYNDQINFLINTFLVFAEKVELIPIETVSGLKLDNETGVNIYDSLTKLVED